MDISNKKHFLTVTDYSVSDIKSIYSQVGVTTFNADAVLIRRSYIATPGTTFNINNGLVSAGLENVFTNIVKVGDIVRVAVKSVQPNKKVKKGEVYKAIVVRSCKKVDCEGGSVRFGDNAVILLGENMQMIGTIVHGAVMRMALNAFPQILPLCEEVY